MANRQSNLRSRKRSGKREVSDRAGQTDEGPKFRKIATHPPDTTVEMITKVNLPSKDVRWDPDKIPVDILVMTAVECELMAVLSFIPPASKMYKKGLGSVYMGNLGTMKIAVMRCKMGSSGTRGTGQIVQKAVTELMPKAVFCVGYCGGLNPEKLKLGDVVISEKLITYESCKVTEGGSKDRSDRVPLKTNLASVIQSAADGWRAPLQDPTELEVDVRCGALLSGSKVVDNNQMREKLLEQFPEGIAIEMEGEGVYAAAHNLDVEWVIIKGVSDFADGKKSNTDDWRPFASLMAASLAVHLLSNSVVYEDWSHYNGGKSSLPSSSDQGKPGGNAGQQGSGSVPSAKDSIKDGAPDEDVLQELSVELGNCWEPVARRLKFKEAEITAFHKENEEYAKKALKMLFKWKQRDGCNATYRVLHAALSYESLVGRRDLAEKFCENP